MAEPRNIRWDIAALIVAAASVFVWLSLLTHDPADPLPSLPGPLANLYQPDIIAYPINEKTANRCGYAGAWLSHLLMQALGAGAYMAASLMGLSVFVMLKQQPWASPLGRSIGWTLVGLSLVTLLPTARINIPISVPIGPGGYLGAMTSTFLHEHFAWHGSLVLIFLCLAAGLLLSTEYAVVRYLRYSAAGLCITGRQLGLPVSWLIRHAADKTAPSRPAVGRSDLPTSLTVRQGESAPTDDGPPIRIGRKANADRATEVDLSSETTSRKTEPTTPRQESEPAPNPNSANSRRSLSTSFASTIARSLLGGKKKDQEAQAEEEEIEEEFEEEEELDEEEIEESIESAIRELEIDGENITARSDEAHEVEGPRVTKRNLKSKDVRKAALDSLEHLDDTKLPEGTEEYVLPSIELLIPGDDVSYDEQEVEVRRKAKILEQTFAHFGLNIRVVEIDTGPVIAQYEIELEPGLRLSKITGLSDDLAIALRVPSVRIVAPIPGKNTVGIEVPNETRQIVRLREVIEESTSNLKKMKIPLFLGKDVSGKALTVDLASLPHLLIAGRTGTGKSVCLNSIITSILMARRPDEVRMLMIDPKMVELSGYARLPHLMHPVVTDMRKAEAILAWAVDKMEERYALLARAGVRHLVNYNQLGHEELHERLKPETPEEAESIPDHLPFIVIVADEIADLMMTAGKEVEQHIIRLAQKSRAVGIHLILATQKPTVDVITGLIKSNLPARISFQVASRVDSRVVLDEMGADKLLGNGDMLFLWPGTSTLLRGQGTYLGDDEINRVVDHCSTGEQNFVHELMHIKVKTEEGEEEDASKPTAFKKRDELYEAAVDVVVREGRGSCSLLQRALGIGYGRAARLIDFMAEDGIVGQYNGSQAREVVISIAQWETMRGGEPSRSDREEVAPPSARKNKIRRDEGWDDSPPAPSPKANESRARRSVTVAAAAAAAEQAAADEVEPEEEEWEEVAEGDESEGEEGEEYEYEDEEEEE
ncbi:MAG: DNA translocase FtsK [Pirellulaceae bacterium]|nr:DNA translocase FtsK [Pirellulaceae bacterium]